MKHFVIFLILTLSFSCKNDSDRDPKLDRSVEMFGIINLQLNQENDLLKGYIDSTSNLTNNTLELNYIDYTEQYLAFIENLKKQFASKNENEIRNFTELEKEFAQETYDYKNKILELTENQERINRLNNVLDIADITNENGEQIKFFNYIFENKSGAASITYLTLKENQLLQMTLDFLNDNLRKNLQPTSYNSK